METLTALHATLLLGSPWMLVFLGALAVPWLIARATRAPLRQVGLGTTSFVLRAARQQHVWKKLPWAIAALRSLVIAGVVLGAAEPIWLPRPADTDETAFGVVVLDNEASIGEMSPVVAAAEATGRAGAADESPRWHVKRLPTSSADSGAVPDDTRLIVLTDGAVPGPVIRRRLTEWIINGGQAWLLLGPRSLASQNGWMLSWLAEAVGVNVEGTRSGVSERIRARLPVTHPIETLAGPSVQSHAVLKSIHSAAVQPQAPPDSNPDVLLETADTGSPLLILRPLGRGQVVISALPWNLAPSGDGIREPAWSDLAAWPAFTVVIEQLLTTCQEAADVAGLSANQVPSLARLSGTQLTGALLIGGLLLLACEALVFRAGRPREAS